MPQVKKVRKKTVRKSSPKKVLSKEDNGRPASKKKGVFSRVQKVSEITYNQPFSVAIFGASGTGKTTLWSTFPKPILALICSGELKNPGEFRSISPVDMEGIDCINLQSPEEINEVVKALRNGEEQYKTLVLDHLTSFSDLVLKQIMGVSEIPPQLSWGFAKQEQWGQHGQLLKTLLQGMIDLPLHTVIVSQQRWFDKPEDSKIGFSRLGPAVTPSVADWLHFSIDYCIQTAIRDKYEEKTTEVQGKKVTTRVKIPGVEFVVNLSTMVGRMTKFRFPKEEELPDEIISPTFQKLDKLING